MHFELKFWNKYKKERKRALKLENIANKANMAKSLFLANMSHEIRTPLNAIQGFIDILLDEETNNRKISHLNIIQRNGQSLLQIINDILDFSKIESGKLDIENEEYNLYEQIDSIASLFCAKANEKGLIFSSYIEPNIPKTFCNDDLRIRQILANLLSNAIKFTPKNGNVSINVTSDIENQKIKFSIKDTGPGISEKFQKTIFESFSQEDNSITKNFGGTGLGLAISSKLSKMLGGELKVKSKLDHGSEFYFSLPAENLKNIESIYTDKRIFTLSTLKIAIIYPKTIESKINIIKLYLDAFKVKSIDEFNEYDEISVSKYDHVIIYNPLITKDIKESLIKIDKSVFVLKNKIDTSFHDNSSFTELVCPLTASMLFDAFMGNSSSSVYKKENHYAEVNFNGKKILLVEDNLSNQKFMSIVLKKLGFVFDIANDGVEAIDLFDKGTYDLILMDENMPNMDGIEATNRILNIEKEKNIDHTPIVALTANALKGERKRFIDAGMDEYLSKPLDKKKLAEVLSGLLN